MLLACGDDGSSPAGTESSTGSPADDDGSGLTTMSGTSTGMPGDDTTTDMPASSSEGSTGPASVCGDEVVEGDEECDDGNTDNGDDCYSDCTLPYQIAWTDSIHGGAADDLGLEIVTDDAGNIYVGGWTDVDVGDADLWIQQIMPDGRLGWSYTYSGMVAGDDLGAALAWAGTDLLIVGSQAATGGGADGVVVRVDPSDQSTVWAVQFDGPSDSEYGDRISDVVVDTDGSIVVAGRMSVDGQDLDGWVARLDDTGALQWEAFVQGDFGDEDSALAIGVDGDGNVHAIGYETTAASTFASWHASYDPAGTETARDTLMYIANDMAVSGDTIAIVGHETPGTTQADGALHVYDASFAEQFVTYVDGPTHDFDSLLGVYIAPDGELYAAGQVTEVNQQDNFWAGRFSASGELLWSNMYNNDRLDITEVGFAMTVDPDGNAIAVGRENQLGEGINAFVRKYGQAPPPA